MSLTFTEIIILLAAAQGIFLAVLLFHKYGKLFATRSLGILILSYSIILGHLIFTEILESDAYYSVAPLIIGIGFLMIPLQYLYAKYLIYNTSRMASSDRIHFLPFLLWEMFWLIALLTLQSHPHLWEFAIGSETGNQPFILFHWLVIIQACLYFYYTLRVLNSYTRKFKKVFSSLDQVKLDWLRYMTYLALALVAGFLLENISRLFGTRLSNQFAFSSILLAIYVYAIGYLGLFKSEAFTSPVISGNIKEIDETNSTKPITSSGNKYEKSGLPPEKAERYREKLLRLMDEDKPYQDSELTLKQLADMLSISPHNLSEVLNIKLGKNFFDFVNEYRVEQVKTHLVDPDKVNLTILSIAYDAGFNSKSSFYTIFKKATGMTPSEYRNQFN